ncbi:MAG: DegV family protein, partial [Mobilitalea sp.]
IITDSTVDITIDQALKMGLTMVPLKVIFGSNEYREGIDISMDGFYQRLVHADKLPTTSQPAPDDFLIHFKEAKAAGDSVIAILIAGTLSGTVQSANIAKQIAGYSEIYIVDSLSTIIGLRLLVEQAVKLRDEGLSAAAIAENLEKMKSKIVLLAMVDTLEYLYKGGRLSKSSAVIGSLLNFKPILTIKDGAIAAIGKERGINKGITKILESMDEFGTLDKEYPVFVGFTAEDSKAMILKEKVVEKFSLQEVGMHPVGCVVGTHVGPGACMVAYIKK